MKTDGKDLLKSRDISPMLLRYGLAALLPCVMLLPSLFYFEAIGSRTLVPFFAAVTISAYVGGFGPGLASALLSAILSRYYLFDPVHSFSISSTQLAWYTVFLLVCTLISWTQETRLRTENKLQETNNLLDAILQGVADGITAQDEDGRTVFSNEAVEGLIGPPGTRMMIDVDDLDTGEFEMDMFGENEPTLSFSEFPTQRALKQGLSSEVTFRLHHPESPEDHWVVIKSSPVRNGEGDVVMAINIIRDITPRRQAEIILRDQRERLRVTVASLGEGVITTDNKGHVELLNPMAETLSGWQQSKVAGQQFDEVFKVLEEDTRQPVENPVGHAIRAGILSDMRVSLLVCSDGRELPIEYGISPIIDETGKSLGAVMAFRDVTQRRQIEKAQERSERHLRHILNTLPIMVGVLTPDGRVTTINRTALDTAGVEPNDVLGKPFEEVPLWSFDAEVQGKLREAIKRAAEGGMVRYDTRVRLSDGQFRDMDFIVSPMYDEHGTVNYVVPAGVDITERKRVENELLRLTVLLDAQRQRLQNVVTNVPGIIWEASRHPDGSQTLDFINPYAERMLGYTLEEWRATPNFWNEIMNPADAERVRQEGAVILESGQPGTVEYRVRAKDGREVHIESHFTLLNDENNVPYGVCGVFMDVTQRKQDQLILEQYSRELSRSNEELQRFAYVASHDLQEPLRMVASYLQLLERRYDTQLDSDAREFIKFAVDGATRMKSLINDLLTYSRVQRGPKDFQLVNLRDVLNRVLSNLQVSIEDNRAAITIDTMPAIMGDEGQLIQLFQNLISNAIKFRKDDPPSIHIGAEQHKQEWVFSIRDNGIGIDPQHLNRVFIIFQRLHTIGQYPGTGIGLAICKKVVENHGGHISVESQVGLGTTFYVTIPTVSSRPIAKDNINGSHPDLAGGGQSGGHTADVGSLQGLQDQ